MTDYCILVPSGSITVTEFALYTTPRFEMWVSKTSAPTEPIWGQLSTDGEAQTTQLSSFPPRPLTQRILKTTSEWKRESALNRPESLGAANLESLGYDFKSGETDPGNLRVIERAIMGDREGYDRYTADRITMGLDILDLLYPGLCFTKWYEETSREEPLTAEFLFEFALAQGEAFLTGGESLFTTVPPTGSTGDPSLTLAQLLGN